MPLIRLIRSQQSVAQINCIRRKVSFKTIHCAHLHAFQRHGLVECLERAQIQGPLVFLPLQTASEVDVMPAQFDSMQRFGLKFIIFNIVREATKSQCLERVRIGIVSGSSKCSTWASPKLKKQKTYL